MTRMTLRDTVKLIEESALSEAMPERVEEKIRKEADALVDHCVGGFHFKDPERASDHVEYRKKQREAAVKNFAEKRDGFIKKLLDELGQAPIAVIPLWQWKEVARKHDLVTVEPTKNGEVGISNEVSHSVAEKIGSRFDAVSGWAIAIGIVAVFVAGFRSAVLWEPTGPVDFVVNTLSSYFFWATLSFLSLVPASVMVVKAIVVKSRLTKWIDSHSRADLLRAVMRDTTDGYYTKAKLRLPEPPAEVVTLLRKLASRGIVFQVTAEAEAIQLDPSAENLFLRGYAEQEAINRALRAADPIITITEGNLVAIMAQFGNFEWERAAVEEVIWDRQTS